MLAAGSPDESFALARITVAELLVGAEKADSTERRQRPIEFVTQIVAEFPVLPLDLPVAEALARLWAGLEADGGRIGPYDMVVAATALVRGYDVLTFNVREVERVPGLVVHRPSWSERATADVAARPSPADATANKAASSLSAIASGAPRRWPYRGPARP